MEFAAAAVERAMTYQQVIMRALAGTWTWLKAADVLGLHPRSLRRWRARYERDPVLGLLDRRRRRPSHRTAPRAAVQRILQLYRERYQGFNVRHFLHLARPPPRPARSRRDALVYVRQARPPGGRPRP
jgi:Winged helix-turn helix